MYCQEEMTKRSRDRDEEMALLAMEEAAANNRLTVAGGNACMVCLFWVKIQPDGRKGKEMQNSTKSSSTIEYIKLADWDF